MIKLKQDILGIKAGSIGNEYGNVDNLMVWFNSEEKFEYEDEFETFIWTEPNTEFTVHMSYIKDHPELFEIIEEDRNE